MRRKYKIWIILFLFLIMLLMIGISCVRKNYALGKELHHFGNEVAYQCLRVADSIDYFKEYFASSEPRKELSRARYDDALAQISLHFGAEDLPFLNGVRLEYYHVIDLLRQKTHSDEELKKVMTGEESGIDINKLRIQLEIVVSTLNDFDKRYTAMSEWERYFTPWKQVREALTDAVRIPDRTGDGSIAQGTVRNH